MNQNVLYFFDSRPGALPLYELFERKVLSEIGSVEVKVQKTQIAFSNRHNFAFVSFLPVRKKRELLGWVKEAAAFSNGKR